MTAIADTEEQLSKALQEISAWEQDQKDIWFWEKLGRLPFMLLDKLTPRFIQQKLGKLLKKWATTYKMAANISYQRKACSNT